MKKTTKKTLKKHKAFKSHRPNGFYLTFPNGNGLSTVWGVATYSDNYNLDRKVGLSDFMQTWHKPIEEGSNLVEVMPECSPRVYKLLAKEFPDEVSGSVFGYLSFEKWLRMVNILATKK